MKRLIKFKIFESPDNPTNYILDDVAIDNIYDLNYKSSDAIPFGYSDISIKLDEIENIEDLLKNKALQKRDIDYYNSLMNNLKIKKKYIEKVKKTIPINDKYMSVGEIGSETCHFDFGSLRSKQEYCGRLWYNHKYISFWKYPENYDILVQVIKDIEKTYKNFYNKDLNIYENRNEWVIELSENEVVKFNDYREGEKYSDEELSIQHLKIGSGGNVPKGLGSKYYQGKLKTDMSQAEYKNKITKKKYTENMKYLKTFENYDIKKMDYILDKINKYSMKSLTKDEKNI